MAAIEAYGGIEGGGTHTTIILLNRNGDILSKAAGPATNHWLIGLEETSKRIAALVKEAKTKAGIDVNTPLKSLGLSMSGGDSHEARVQIEKAVMKQEPAISESYHVCCDVEGAIATAFEHGGVVFIAGTGSNCAVTNPDGSRHRVGGWGHAIGDEGSGYWIAHYCLKKMFDIMDNLDNCGQDPTFVFDLMCKHFKVKDRMHFLEHLYPKIDKSNFAAMGAEIAKGAIERKDPLCIEAFYKGGWYMARHILAISPKIDKSLLQDGRIKVACIGSVFKSWDLMKQGFLDGIQPRNGTDIKIKEVTLLELARPGTIGAVYLGVRKAGLDIKRDYAANSRLLYHCDNL